MAGRMSAQNRYLLAAAKLAIDAYNYIAFPHQYGQFRGVFESFEQAEASVPRGGKVGYDHEELGREYQAKLDLRLDSFDYPILFHLDRIVSRSRAILDFGGNIGVHYLRYRRYLKLENVKWIVLDVPAITRAGRETCADMDGITFVNHIAEITEPQIDVLLASGSMQYVQHVASPELLLRKMNDHGLRPDNILINRLPLHGGPQFVTLQNGGPVFYPQHVFNRTDYINAITNMNYELLDTWFDSANSCIIPFNRKMSVRAYTGLYFSQKSGN
jgi:putative methyltransferase (TIGR04325 family)